MAKTASKMGPLGSPAPDFSLPDVHGQIVRRDDAAGRPMVVAFICNHCPFVIHLRAGLRDFGRDLSPLLTLVAINSNDPVAHPADAPAAMAIEAAAAGYTFPYLFDASQAVARAYGAACTPDFFLFDASHHLRYRGQFDGSRPGNAVPVTGADLRAACTAVLAGQPVAEPQRPSLGCNIKWRPDGAPQTKA